MKTLQNSNPKPKDQKKKKKLLLKILQILQPQRMKLQKRTFQILKSIKIDARTTKTQENLIETNQPAVKNPFYLCRIEFLNSLNPCDHACRFINKVVPTNTILISV